MSWMKVVIVVFLVVIVASLFSALLYLIRGHHGGSKAMVKALTLRIGLSVFLFLLLFFAFSMGWISPHAP